MVTITCDICGKDVGIMDKVSLRGVVGKSGDTQREPFESKDFCCPDCFWVWARKYDPMGIEKNE